jgi:hypothetical protein
MPILGEPLIGMCHSFPSPQSQIETEERLHALREYARDFRRRHTTDARDFHWDLDDEDYGLAIGRLVVT